jgi:hypothetical protein
MYTLEEMIELTNSDLISRVDIVSEDQAAIVYSLARWQPGTLFEYSRRRWNSLRCALEIHGASRTVSAGRIEVRLNGQESLGLACEVNHEH